MSSEDDRMELGSDRLQGVLVQLVQGNYYYMSTYSGQITESIRTCVSTGCWEGTDYSDY